MNLVKRLAVTRRWYNTLCQNGLLSNGIPRLKTNFTKPTQAPKN